MVIRSSFLYVLIQHTKIGEGGLFTDLTPPHCRVCLKPEPGFPLPISWPF